ncbi:HNH endonuclease [Pseudarthrobacter equi]|uniref:HNH endonuclease n=1 Tax=Pseudarthrobacter equi TaxID=728066 RepID=UPI0012FD36EF|nr:HNH endonuclease [Pseudarthrobacter equi]
MANRTKPTDRERFYAKTVRVGSGCLIWTGYKTERGYGQFSLYGKNMGAHRAAWILEHGELLTAGQILLHSCDTPSCVEVAHLRVGTHEENMADVRAHGRHNMALGENHYLARFTDAEVERIRSMAKDGLLQRDIAAIMNCSRSYVGLVANGKVRTKPTARPSLYHDKEGQDAKAKARRTRLLEITSVVHPDDQIEGEEWRETPYPGYWASSLGRVRGRSKAILTPILMGDYYVVDCGMKEGTKTRNRKGVHVLVCEAWHGTRPAGKHAAHINGDAFDNRPSNLRWATPLENGNDRVRHGTTMVGSRNPAAKLTDASVREIRRRLAVGGNTIRALAKEYGVHPSAISQLRDNKTWRHVT